MIIKELKAPGIKEKASTVDALFSSISHLESPFILESAYPENRQTDRLW